jgi:putative transposase
MARKRYSDEDMLKLLREINVYLHDGLDVVSACRKASISDKIYYHWSKKFGGMEQSQLSEMRAFRKENARLQKIVTDLQLDKLILKESLGSGLID